MTRTIYHSCRKDEWTKAEAEQSYCGSSQDRADGFIHFSSAAQVRESVAKHRAGQDGLVLVAVHAALLGQSLKWEPARNGQLFPHLYGPLPLSALRWVRDLPLDPVSGHHVFPPIED